MGSPAAGQPSDQGIHQHLCQSPAGISPTKGTPGRVALPISGDDEAAKAIVLKLVDELGFDAIDAGGLDECSAAARHASIHQRTLMPMVCGMLCLKLPKSGPKNGAPPRRAPVVSTRPLEALHLLFRNVRYWHKADMLNALTNVRFWGQSGR